MVFLEGRRYLFMTQRYAFSGTVKLATPTHVILDKDAMIHYDDVGDLATWSTDAKHPGSPVPGQVVSVIGTDATPIGWIV